MGGYLLGGCLVLCVSWCKRYFEKRPGGTFGASASRAPMFDRFPMSSQNCKTCPNAVGNMLTVFEYHWKVFGVQQRKQGVAFKIRTQFGMRFYEQLKCTHVWCVSVSS